MSDREQVDATVAKLLGSDRAQQVMWESKTLVEFVREYSTNPAKAEELFNLGTAAVNDRCPVAVADVGLAFAAVQLQGTLSYMRMVVPHDVADPVIAMASKQADALVCLVNQLDMGQTAGLAVLQFAVFQYLIALTGTAALQQANRREEGGS